MRLLSTVAAAAIIAGTAAPASAQTTVDAASFYNLFQKISAHYSILLARSFVDLTYDQLTIEPGTNTMVLSGLKIYPILDWDQEGNCEITVDRAVSGEQISFETLGTAAEISGIFVPAACLDPQVGGMLSGFGYEGLNFDSASLEIAYNLPESSADLSITAAVADAADVSISAQFDYLWFNLPLDGYGDPLPVAQLGQAEVVIENKGVWERVEPMVAAQMGDLNAIPQMAQMMVGQAFTEGGTRQPTDAENAFVQNLSGELARFLEEKNRIVITSAPDGGVWLDESVFDSPQNMISALEPSISATPAAYRSIVPPAAMAAALADGANPDEAARLSIGRALLTGVGAPRSLEDGGRLLEPLARAWNGEAAALLADAAADVGEDGFAYEMALIALASGDMSALGTADALESRMTLSQILELQGTVGDAWPGEAEYRTGFMEAIAAGDVGKLRKDANAASVGRGLPRSYEAAYTLATLAAAGGDRSAANLRDRLDRRFAGNGDWNELIGEAGSIALQIWTEGGLGDAISSRAQ
ncbi:MAG: hypothetical protein AAF666_08365 [Pseudomonadota bacterium]